MKRTLLKLHPCLSPLFWYCFLVLFPDEAVETLSKKLVKKSMNLLLTLSCFSLVKRMSLSTLSYAFCRSINIMWDSNFLFLFISRTELRINILSLHVLDDRNPFCSAPMMSSFAIRSPNLFA